jgi:protein dithiol:quinone oxidoreductase
MTTSELKEKFVTTENILLFIVVSTAALLGFAFVLEFFVDLVPCPLCIVQRIFYLFIGIVALLGVFKTVQTRTVGVWASLLAILGGSVAFRQVWLQHTPALSDSVGCTVSFGSFIDSFLYALGGRGNCAIVDWTFLSFSIAEWSLLWFGIFFVIGVVLYKQGEKV